MMGEPCQYNHLDMSTSPNLNPIDTTTTTIAEPGTMSEEKVMENLDVQMVTTEALAERNMVVMSDTVNEVLSMGEVTIAADECSDFVKLVEQMVEVPTALEPSMVVDVDPLACPISAYLSADEAVLSPSSGTPLRSASITPATPQRGFLSATENTPEASVSGYVANIVQEASADGERDLGLRKKVVGRRLAVVEDDGETQTSKSATSADEEVMTTASSSKARNKGIKRGRRIKKDKDWKYEEKTEEESSEEKRKKKKGKKRNTGRKDTPEELSDGECGEPKGVVDLVLEDLTSSVLGGAIMEWVNRVEEIRVKSKKFQGRMSGEMKKCMTKIKEGTALLVVRSEAKGDPQILRMRNSELGTLLRESENENARLKEQLRKVSLGPSPPRRKRRIEKVEDEVDVPQAVPVKLTSPKKTVAANTSMREEFPPLPQRPPRVVTAGDGSVRGPSLMPDFSTAVCDSGTETCAEAYFTRHIKFLTAARDMERQRREQQRKEQVSLHKDRRKEIENVDRRGDMQEGIRKAGPRIISDVQVAPPYMSRPKEGATTSAVSGSDLEWKVVGGRRKRGGGNAGDKSLPPSIFLCFRLA